jgi:hypothetical protein
MTEHPQKHVLLREVGPPFFIGCGLGLGIGAMQAVALGVASWWTGAPVVGRNVFGLILSMLTLLLLHQGIGFLAIGVAGRIIERLRGVRPSYRRAVIAGLIANVCCIGIAVAFWSHLPPFQLQLALVPQAGAIIVLCALRQPASQL